MPVAALGVLLTLACAAGAFGAAAAPTGWLVFVTSGDGVSGRLEIAAVAPDGRGFRRITTHSPSGFAPRWTTDARSIVFTTHDPFTGHGAVWRMRADGTRRVRLSGDASSVPSPSGRLVADRGGRGIELSSPNGRRIRTLRLPLSRNDFYDGPMVWSRDERHLAVGVATETDRSVYVRVFVVSADGRSPGRAVTPKVNDLFAYPMSWSPDGRTLAVDTSSTGAYTAITLVRRDGRKRRTIVPDAAGSWAHAWSPDGSAIAYVGRKGGIFRVAVSTRRVRLLARTHSFGDEVRSIDVGWSRTGGIAFSEAGGIYAVRSDGSRLRRLTKRGAWADVDWAPRGDRLTFSERHDVYVIRADGTGLRRISEALQDDSPVPSPDGRKIAFIRGPRGLDDPDLIQVYVTDAAGRAVRRLGRGYGPRWAPDSRRVAFVDVLPDDPPQLGALRTGRIVVADVDGGTAVSVATGTAPTWSPEGSALAFMRYDFEVRDTWRGVVAWPTGSSLWVVVLDGSPARRLLASTADGEAGGLYYQPSWSPDGRWIALLGGAGVTLVDPRSGALRSLPEIGEEFAWSPDGQRLAGAGAFPDELRVVDVRSGDLTIADAERESLDHRYPAWAPDGGHIGFVGCAGEDENDCDVFVVRADGTERRRVTRTRGVEGGLAWAAGG